MYLDDGDVKALLSALRNRLAPNGAIILRESTVRRGRRFARGEYQAIYRSVEDYRALTGANEVRKNAGYERFEIAADVADLVPGDSGTVTWRVVKAAAPIAFRLLPKLMDALTIEWPRLQNHFFRLTA
jgi:hypothetical protein